MRRGQSWRDLVVACVVLAVVAGLSYAWVRRGADQQVGKASPSASESPNRVVLPKEVVPQESDAEWMRSRCEELESAGFVEDHYAHSGEACKPVLSPDERVLAVVTRVNLRLYDCVSWRLVSTMTPVGGVRAIAFSPDHRQLAVAEAKGGVTVWDVARGRKLRAVEAARLTNVLSWHPSGRFLACSKDNTHVYRLPDGSKVSELRSACAIFTTHGLLVAPGRQKMWRTWSLSDDGQAREEARRPERPVDDTLSVADRRQSALSCPTCGTCAIVGENWTDEEGQLVRMFAARSRMASGAAALGPNLLAVAFRREWLPGDKAGPRSTMVWDRHTFKLVAIVGSRWKSSEEAVRRHRQRYGDDTATS